jgi:hypothetical protein
MMQITIQMATALSKFQAACPEINLDGEVKFGNTKFKYATLGNILKSTKGPLKEAGLARSQPIMGDKLYTILTCIEDGSSLQSEMTLPNRNKLQETGADITYCRRYMYVSILGIVGEDDKDAENMEPVSKKPVMTKQLFDKAMARIADGEPGILKKSLEMLTIPESFLRQLKEAEDALSS